MERMGVSGRATVVQRTRHGFVGEASLQSANYHCDGKVVAASDITQIPAALLRVSLASDVAFSSRWVAMLNREVKRLRLQMAIRSNRWTTWCWVTPWVSAQTQRLVRQC